MGQKNKNEKDVYLKNSKNGGKIERAGNDACDDKSISSATTANTMATFQNRRPPINNANRKRGCQTTTGKYFLFNFW